MYGVHLQYLCQYITEWKPIFFDELTKHIVYKHVQTARMWFIEKMHSVMYWQRYCRSK